MFYRDMAKKKSMMSPSSFSSKAPNIDMALPMCVNPEETKKKKCIMPPSSFGSKASNIDMALPMCVNPEETSGVYATSANTPNVKPASACMSASTDPQISSSLAESVDR